MRLSILFEDIHPRIKATVLELNAEFKQLFRAAGLKFTPDTEITLQRSANGFPVGWNVGELETNNTTYTVWANFEGQVGVANGYTPPNRWYTPEELVTTLQRRGKREASFKAKPDSSRLVSMLKLHGKPKFAYYRPPADPAKPIYGESWYDSSDPRWMGRNIDEYFKTHNQTPEILEKMLDSFCMTVMSWRWKKVQEKAGLTLPEAPESSDFHTDDEFERDDNTSLLVNKDTIALTPWRVEYQPTKVVTWWPKEIMDALRQVWQTGKNEFIAGMEEAKSKK